MPYATYRFNKIIAAETIRFIVTVAIVVYKGLKLVVYRMLTLKVLQYFQYSTDKIKTDRTQSPKTVIRHCRFSLYLYIFPVTDFYF